MKTLEFHTVDVFTDRPFTGNPLAIVLGADGLSDEQMQTIAREFNLSETIFVRKPKDAAHTASVRIFFPTGETPFAGHPTIGCASFLASREEEGSGDFSTEITLEEVAGLVPVEVTRKAGRLGAELAAPVIPRPHDGKVPVRQLCAAALGVEEEKIGFADHRPGVFQGGTAFLYIPLADRETLASARPCEPYWSSMIEAAKIDSAYVYHCGEAPGVIRARMFSPTAGIPEDPATGSAAALLAGQLLAAGELSNARHDFLIHQGVEMGRPSQLRLSIDFEDGAITEVRVAGGCVPISSGTIRLP